MNRRPRITAFAVAIGLLASACAGGAASDGDEPASTSEPDLHVVVTTTILGDLVDQLVAKDGTVDVLMQAGQDPHGYAASARQAEALREADLVVANGLGLEEALRDLLDAAAQDGVRVLEVAPQLDPAGFEDHDAHGAEDADDHGEADGDDHSEADGDGHGHAHEGEDPHVWYDPLRMARAAEVIAQALAEVDAVLPDAEWLARGEALAAELRAAHGEVVEILAAVPERCRVLVTNHDSFGYFAARYDFEIVGTVVPGTSSQAEPSARDVAELVEVVRERGVPAIFAETTASNRVAETLAAEVGRDVIVETLYTDSLGPSGSGAETYRGMILTNAQRIADALGSC